MNSAYNKYFVLTINVEPQNNSQKCKIHCWSSAINLELCSDAYLFLMENTHCIYCRMIAEWQ